MGKEFDPVQSHGGPMGDVVLQAENVSTSFHSAHPTYEKSVDNNLQSKEGKGHSELGKGPQMADRKHERVDTSRGYSGHNTHTGEAPVHPNFGVGK